MARQFIAGASRRGAGALVVAPVAYWLITERHDLVALYQSSIAPMAAKDWFMARAVGLGNATWVPFAFLFPLDLIVFILFPVTLRRAGRRSRKG